MRLLYAFWALVAIVAVLVLVGFAQDIAKDPGPWLVVGGVVAWCLRGSLSR